MSSTNTGVLIFLQLSEGSTIAEAIETLKSKGFDQVPVVTAEGVCKGTVTIGNLTSLLVSGRVKCEDSLDKALYKQFKKVLLIESSRSNNRR